MTLAERAAHFAQTFPQYKAAWPWIVSEQGRPVMYATWCLGPDYRNKTGYYGSYPPAFLDRVMAFFPEFTRSAHVKANRASEKPSGVAVGPGIARTRVLHAFSGSLPAGDYTRCDTGQPAELRCKVEELPQHVEGAPFWLTVADPPYSKADAERYGTPMIDRRRVTRALADVTAPGGHLAWLDCVWPMHAKAQWTTVGRITIIRSTNHRVRLLTLFERTAAPTSDGAAPQAGPRGEA